MPLYIPTDSNHSCEVYLCYIDSSTHAVHHNVLCMMNLIIKTLDIPLAKDKISLK